MGVLIYTLSGLSLLMSGVLLLKLKGPSLGLFAKLLAGALSPFWALFGITGALLGWFYNSLWAVPPGILGAGMMIWYVWKTTRNHSGFQKAFGNDWLDRIQPRAARKMIQRRWKPFLKMASGSKIVCDRNIVFWQTPDKKRELLCDIWRPDDGETSGLGFIYLHGSGWAAGDKDFQKTTRPFFRHLAGQGHTVMDVAYRLCPEVNIYDMVGDVKRAISWMKSKSVHYRIKPEKIVLGGGSAGAHLALLAAYTPELSELTPRELKGTDLAVCGVVSFYAPIDLADGFSAWKKANPFSDATPVDIGTKIEPKMQIRYAGRMDVLLGGSPDEKPDVYKLVNPVTHVSSKSPPTLLFQGARDCLVPDKPTRLLYEKLKESGVPAINVIYPLTDHIFDLVLPQISPPAQSALYDVDRFLALMLTKH